MTQSFEDFQDLEGTGFSAGGEKVQPEDEFFHSVYIAGKTRKNHINIEEQTGKLQIRGVQYNLDTVHLVITHVKEILANITREQGRDNVKCFSFKDGAPPWYGTSKLSNGNKRQCPQTSAERAVNDFCSNCRAQLIVAGIYCKSDGTPILTEEKKPIFVFLRGKGMRYANISEYLAEMYKEDLSPIFEPATEQSKEFEKKVVNNKRFVTRVSKTTAESSFGNTVAVFSLEKGNELPKDSVLNILKLSKQTVDKFNDKFDWSKGKEATGYSQQAEGILPMDDSQSKTNEKDEGNETEAEQGDSKFSFDDITF